MKLYNVFYSNLLCKASIDQLTDQVDEPPSPIIINNKEEWKIKDIFDARSHQNKLQYRVKWDDWDEDREWYDVVGFENSLEIVKDFHFRYPEKPRPAIPIVQKSRRKRN